MGGSSSPEARAKLDQVYRVRALSTLTTHPNYQQPTPNPGESPVAYALRCASHLVSPPQESDESFEIECTQVAQAIRDLEEAIEAAWAQRET